MEKQKFARVFLNAALVFALSGASFGAFAATSSPNVSLGKNLYVAGAVNSNWKPEVYTDGKLDFNQVSSVSDFALNVGEGPTKLFITWETVCEFDKRRRWRLGDCCRGGRERCHVPWACN